MQPTCRCAKTAVGAVDQIKHEIPKMMDGVNKRMSAVERGVLAAVQTREGSQGKASVLYATTRDISVGIVLHFRLPNGGRGLSTEGGDTGVESRGPLDLGAVFL